MQSITLRKVKTFNITGTLSITDTRGDQIFGSIALQPGSYIVNGKSFVKYIGILNNYYDDAIDVEIEGVLRHVDKYQKTESFDIFYSREAEIILVFAGTRQAKSFLDQLTNNYPDDVELDNYDFTFPDITTDAVNNKALFFNVTDDEHVDSMAAFGDDVDQNVDVSSAIDERRATYLMAQMDIGSTSYTLGFSKKSAIVIYQTMTVTTSENAYLQLAIDTLQLIKVLK